MEQGIPGQHVLALTFTNKAADEMSRRIERLTGDPTVWVGTFHRFCARLLRKYAPLVGLQENYTIYDTDDSHQALRQALDAAEDRRRAVHARQHRQGHKLGQEQSDRSAASTSRGRATPWGKWSRRPIRRTNASWPNRTPPISTTCCFTSPRCCATTPKSAPSLDERYRFILVDEYQDTNLAQYAIARALSVDHPNLAVTGDPDQSIYGWRGANLNNILEFERDFPEVHVVRLEQNYRSTQRILRVAAELIAHNVRRKEKGLFTENGQGVPVRLVTYPTQKDEADGIAARIAADIAAGRRRRAISPSSIASTP